MKHDLHWGLGTLLSTIAAVGCFEVPPTSKERPVMSKPPETDQAALFLETKTSARLVVSEIVSERLKAPTQAHFSERTLLESHENFALVSVIVDAPNGFGVMLRQTWCSIIRFEPPRGAKYVWHPSTGAWDCSAGIQPKDLLIRKVAIDWPGAAMALIDHLVTPEQRVGVHSYLTKMSTVSGFSEVDLHRWACTFFIAGGTAQDIDQFVAAVLDVSTRYDDPHQGATKAAVALISIYSTNRASDHDLADLKVKKGTSRTKKAVFSAIAGPGKALGSTFLASAKLISH